MMMAGFAHLLHVELPGAPEKKGGRISPAARCHHVWKSDDTAYFIRTIFLMSTREPAFRR